MPELFLTVGPPGSGKSTYAKSLEPLYVRISQDDSGRAGHLTKFREALSRNDNIVIDRMNFNRQQRAVYISEAKALGYDVSIMVFHESYATCLKRCLERENHPTITKEEHARSALQTFFTKYERPIDSESDNIMFEYPTEYRKPKIVVSDIDGTIADVEHRRHYVQVPEGQKKNWKMFFEKMTEDPIKYPVYYNLDVLSKTLPVVYCSGRPDNYRKQTHTWLVENKFPNGELYMRNRVDSRQDDIIKEIILDFELLTRYDILMWFDDRNQVVDMLRRRGINVFQVAEGNF